MNATPPDLMRIAIGALSGAALVVLFALTAFAVGGIG